MRVHLSLGSNLGARETKLAEALKALDTTAGIELKAVSACYETEPIGVTGQPPFLNLAATIETDHEPLELLAVLKEIERRIGRLPAVAWGPRIIDIDLVLWEGRQMDHPTLSLPHRAFRERAFVLKPLAEIAPDAVDPATGQTVAVLAASPNLVGWVRRTDRLDRLIQETPAVS